MKKLLVTTVLLLALILSSTVAYAGLSWDGDPEFKVDGTTVNVLIGVEDGFAYDPSEVRVTVRVPKDVEVSDIDAGGFALEIIQKGRAKRHKIPVKVTVRFPKARPNFVVGVTVKVPEYGISKSRDGRTGRNIKVKVNIPIDD